MDLKDGDEWISVCTPMWDCCPLSAGFDLCCGLLQVSMSVQFSGGEKTSGDVSVLADAVSV